MPVRPNIRCAADARTPNAPDSRPANPTAWQQTAAPTDTARLLPRCCCATFQNRLRRNVQATRAYPPPLSHSARPHPAPQFSRRRLPPHPQPKLLLLGISWSFSSSAVQAPGHSRHVVWLPSFPERRSLLRQLTAPQSHCQFSGPVRRTERSRAVLVTEALRGTISPPRS